MYSSYFETSNQSVKRKGSSLQNRTTVNTSFSVLITVKPIKNSVIHRKYKIGVLDSICFYFHKNKRKNVYISLCEKVVKESLSVINFINYDRIEKKIEVNKDFLVNNFLKKESCIGNSDFVSDANNEVLNKDIINKEKDEK